MKHKLLFIDDEQEVLNAYEGLFKKHDSSRLESLAADFLDEDLSDVTQMSVFDKMDFSVTTASQGEEGINLFKQALQENKPFEVVFVDMRMPPGIDGVETARRIREMDSHVEIVMVTAYSDIDLSDIVQKVGSPDKFIYVKKPFDREEIRQLALNLTVKYKNERIKDDFLSNVSHEMRTPLSAILGFSELLNRDEKIHDGAREQLNILHYNGKILKNLIDELFQLLEVSSSKFKLDCQSQSVNGFLQSVVQSCERVYEDRKQIDFKVSYLEEDKNVSFDAFRLGQCLFNLVNNAFKFTEKGMVSIGVEAQKEGVAFFVQDSGMGMDPDKVKHIFDRFYRGENIYHEKEGLGIGLSVVKNIVDQHQGRVGVESELSVGSTFSVFIPYRESERSAA